MPALPGSTRTHHPVPLKCPSNLLLLSLPLSPLSQRGMDLGHCELLLERFPKLAPLFEIKEERGPSLFSPFTHCNYSISSLSAIHWLSARPRQPGHRSAQRTSPCFPEKDWNVLSAASAASRTCQSPSEKLGLVNHTCSDMVRRPQVRKSLLLHFIPWSSLGLLRFSGKLLIYPKSLYSALLYFSRIHSKVLALWIFRSAQLPCLYLYF